MTKLIAPAAPGWPDVTRFETVERLLGGDGGPLNRAPLELLERSEYLKKKIDDAVSGALTIEYANRLKTTRSIAMTGDGSWVVTFDGSGNVTAAMTLANTGVAAGTYPVVTIDSKGRVTGARALICRSARQCRAEWRTDRANCRAWHEYHSARKHRLRASRHRGAGGILPGCARHVERTGRRARQ
jgi:hypothetical protein